MARARTAPASSATAQQAQPKPPNFDAFVAATGAGELLPPEAVVGAVPVGGALTVAAGAAAAASILAAFDAFNRKRVRQLRVYLSETLVRLNPDRTAEEVLRYVRDEVARDREFVRNQRDRLDKDLKAAMLLDTPEKRRLRIQAILDREKRWTQMHEKAALERAAARTQFLTVKEQSPEGAFWILGYASVHTPDCVAMAGHFWPWEVLDHLHPQLHHGCQCELLTKDEAIRRGLMHPDQVPNVADAVRRAAEIARAFHLIHEAATEEEIDAYLEAILEAPYSAINMHRQFLRYPKGTHEGGKFKPKNAVGHRILARQSIERALRALIPHAPSTPAERRRDHVGEWKKIAGREVFVPEHRAFEREIAGRMWYSPPGSTRVYEQKDYVRRSPEISRERGAALTDTALKQRQEWRREARSVAERALQTQDRRVLPAAVGAHPKATHSGMLDAGFRLQKQEINPSGSITHRYVHPGSGAEAQATYHEGRVTSVLWTPGETQEVKPLLTRPPESVPEFLDDVFSIAHEIAGRYDRAPDIARVTINERLGDTAGVHGWDGVLQLGPDAATAIRQMAKARAEGRPLTFAESRAVYAAYRTAVHEALHAAAPLTARLYTSSDTARGIEEALTEDLAGVEVVDVLRHQGLDDVLKWLKANPTDPRVEGHYTHYRHALTRIFDVATLDPHQREDAMRVLKFSFEPEQRPDGLASLLTKGGSGYEQNHQQALAWIDGLFKNAHRREDDPETSARIFAPNIRPDLSDVPDTPPVLVHGAEVLPGSWVDVKGRQGRVMAIHVRDEGPLFDVQFGTKYATTGTAHGVHPEEITSVRSKPEGSLPGAGEVQIDGEMVRAGDRVSYLNAAENRVMATVERITRTRNPHLRTPEEGWQIEARTDDGEPVVLAHGRARGMRKEGAERASPSSFVDPNTISVETGLGPVTFSSHGDAIGQEYHATYTARLADGAAVGTLSVAYLGDTAAIQMIDVPEQYRRQGVASALVQRVRNEQAGVKIETLGDVATPEGRAFIAAGRQRSAPRQSPGDHIPNDQRVYIAEGAMKRGGLDGGEMISRPGHAHHPDPEGRAEADRLSKEAQEISGDPTLRVDVTNWISGPGGQVGHASYDRLTHKIAIRPVSDKLTFLHEIAHAMTHTEHGAADGHGIEFVRTARDLYEKHISPEAASVFWNLAVPPGEIIESDSKDDLQYAPLEIRAAAGRPGRPQKCKYGDHPATKSLLWAEGRAYVPVCDAHEERARKRIVDENKDEVLATIPIRESFEEHLHPRDRRGRWQDVPHMPHIGKPEHHALYDSLWLDDATLLAGVRRAVEERPERITHGNTGDNSFFIVGDKAYARSEYLSIPREERGRAIMVHSHSADGVSPSMGSDYFEHEPKQPLNSGDMEIWLSEMRKDRMGPRQVMIYADGTADILGVTHETDAKVLAWGSKRIRDSMPSIASADARETYREWFAQHGFSYHEQVRWATPAEASHWRAQHPNESIRKTGMKMQELAADAVLSNPPVE